MTATGPGGGGGGSAPNAAFSGNGVIASAGAPPRSRAECRSPWTSATPRAAIRRMAVDLPGPAGMTRRRCRTRSCTRSQNPGTYIVTMQATNLFGSSTASMPMSSSHRPRLSDFTVDKQDISVGEHGDIHRRPRRLAGRRGTGRSVPARGPAPVQTHDTYLQRDGHLHRLAHGHLPDSDRPAVTYGDRLHQGQRRDVPVSRNWAASGSTMPRPNGRVLRTTSPASSSGHPAPRAATSSSPPNRSPTAYLHGPV